jgi:ubiquinone/menaquinone biosynthesis C-methylase UbiE
MKNSIGLFSDKAEIYNKYRLGYPNEILQYLYGYGFDSNSIIADIGSGTGKLTRIFVENGNKIYAVEPNDNMRLIAENDFKENKNFISIIADAENTTLQNNSIQFIVVGQAFHWFNKDETMKEFKRIITENGVLMLIWYTAKYDTQFLKKYEEILKFNPDYKGDIHKSKYTDEDLEKLFAKEFKKIKCHNNVEIDFDNVLGRFMSSSYSPKTGTELYNKSFNELRKIFDKYEMDNKIIFKYEMEIYIGRI